MALTIAILPARGGSKRVPRKNIRSIGGKPMIAWPIGVAVKSGFFDQIVVSSDDDEVRRVGIEAGATQAVERPSQLADDFTPLRPVINDAISQVEAMSEQRVTLACCILPTAILMRPVDLAEGYDAVTRGQHHFAFAAATFASPIQRALRRVDGGVAMMYPEHRFTRSQDLEEAIHDAGQFYWGARDAFVENLPMYGDGSMPIIIPRQNECDIDTPEDFELAEQLLAVMTGAAIKR